MTTTPVLPSLTDEQIDNCLPLGMAQFSTLCGPLEIRAFARAIESLSRAPDRPSDDALWDQTLRERDNYHEWADKLSERISRFIGLDIGEHGSANNPWARAIDMIPRGTLTEALASRAPAEPAVLPTEAVVGFAAWLTSRPGTLTAGASHDAAPWAAAVHEYVVAQGWTDVREGVFPHNLKRPHLSAHPTESAGPAPAGMLLVSEAALRQIARAIEGLKRECGMDPESPQAIRNAQYMSLAYAVRKLGESHEG